MLQNTLKRVSSLIFPPTCEICSVPAQPSQPGICKRCVLQIQWIRPPFCKGCGRTTGIEKSTCAQCAVEHFYFDQAFACAWYNGAMKELMHAYKFGGKKYLKHFFSENLLHFFQEHLSTFSLDAIVSVPATPSKLRERGFNQAHLLSAALSRGLGLSDLSAYWDKTKPGASQSLLSKKERQINPMGRFAIRKTDKFVGRKILLVDDILTTGRTASACAEALKKSGASSVTVLTCARGL